MGLLKECMPDNACYGKGKDAGPKTFLADNNNDEREALSCTWKSSVLLLCIFHVMEAIWRWLCDKKVRQEHRHWIIEHVKKITYAESVVDDAVKSYEEMVSEFSGRYDNFADYFDNNIWINRDCWCKALMQDLHTRGNFTQNFVKSQFRS